MKDKNKMRLAIAFAVLILGGLVYYWFFYTPTLGDYVYLERTNEYSFVIHSKENCSEIHKGVFRHKTSEALKKLREYNPNILYCSKCMSFDMINKYNEEIKRQKEEERRKKEKIAKVDMEHRQFINQLAEDILKATGDSSDYYGILNAEEEVKNEMYEEYYR